ncbi:MAG: NAD(P)-binding domain-containing protein, partial [Terrimicrobiaceae bacterium]
MSERTAAVMKENRKRRSVIGKVLVEAVVPGKLFQGRIASDRAVRSPSGATVKLLAPRYENLTFGRMRYAFLGAGKMALALIQGMLRANLCSASEITVSSRSRPGLENLVAATGTRAAASNAEAVEEAGTVLLCVKPSDALRALEEAGEALEGRLLLSVVTGLKIAALREA